MATKDFNPSLIDEGLGGISIAASILFSPLLRPWYSQWGATAAERKKSLPGDELVPNPALESTRGITIRAPTEAIWPWLLQLGQGRGGFYTYQRLENLAGCQIHNANQIRPELQNLEVGDLVRLGPEGYPAFDVAAIEPQVALILQGDIPNPQGKPTTWIWIFYLDPIDTNTTRLILRTRLDYEPNLGNAVMWRVFTDPISFNMERRMLQGIKARAEATDPYPAR
jgi:hypothetical protein